MPDLISYVEDAIDRLGGDAPLIGAGSHSAGVFNKAASGFERKMVAYAIAVTGNSKLRQRTLGQVITVLEGRLEATVEPLRTVLVGARQANDTWVLVKHGTDPTADVLLKGLRGIRTALCALPTDTA